jgi:hypothetical protein
VIFDTDGQVLRKFATPPGETRSVETVLMTPGNYRVEFHAARADGQELPEVEFELLGKSLSLPIGPGISDPTNTPILSCRDPGADPSFCSPVDMPVTDPIVLPELSVPPLPSPLVSVGTPWLDPSWWYWNTPSLPISAMATPVAPAVATRFAANTASQLIPAPSLEPSAEGEADNGTVFSPIATVPGMVEDVNQDGAVAPIDALLVLNYVNERTSNSTTAASILPSLDVNNDGHVTSIDALMVINHLNGVPTTAAEAEAPANPSMQQTATTTSLDKATGKDGEVVTPFSENNRESIVERPGRRSREDPRHSSDRLAQRQWSFWRFTDTFEDTLDQLACDTTRPEQ